MPPKKVGCSIFLFDANSSSEFKERAINCYKEICERIFFSDNDSVSKLYLMNACDDDNPKQTTFCVTDYVCYNPCNRKYLEKAQPAEGNWLHSLEIAVDDLHSCFEQKLYSKYQVVILSDLSTPLKIESSDIQRKIESLVDKLYTFYGYVYFIGIDVQPPSLLTDKISVYEWAQNMNVSKSNSSYSIAAKIIKKSLGVMCDFDIGTDLFITYSETSRGFPFTEPLVFGDIKLPTSAMKLIDKVSSLTPKNTTECLSVKYVLAEEQDVLVPEDEVVRGRVFHNKLIIIPDDVAKGMKDYPRFFKLLGFTDSKNVPNHYMLSQATNIITNYNQTDPEVGYINYIIEAAEKYNKYGIALKAHMKNSRPKLFCLIPKTSPHYFIMVELPYAEGFLSVYKENDLTAYKQKQPVSEDIKIEDDLKTDVFAYLDSINLDDKILLHPSRRLSDGKKRLASMLLNKFEGRELQETCLKPFNKSLEVEIKSELKTAFDTQFNSAADKEPEDLW